MVERIRGRRLQAIRSAHLRANPLCVMCLAHKPTRIKQATELDHIVALTNGGDNDPSNYQGLCAACHIDKTAIDMGFRPIAHFDDAGRVVW
jgi:5-methylcytosine-specific restriction protein A